jgi:REP element-mobilizing transposase RayT
MGRNRYTITEADKPHFLTCTVLGWLAVFTRPDTVKIILDCWQYQRQNKALKLYGYVILENHLHFIAQAPRLDKTVAEFKSFTARTILDYLKEQHQQHLLKQFAFLKKRHKVDRSYQFWQEGVHAELILHDEMMRKKLDYIHHNPVKRGYVNQAEHWRYSSAANYFLGEGLIEVDMC